MIKFGTITNELLAGMYLPKIILFMGVITNKWCVYFDTNMGSCLSVSELHCGEIFYHYLALLDQSYTQRVQFFFFRDLEWHC